MDDAPIWTNLTTFPWQEFSGLVDILSGGFPCQPFSSAGAKAADKDPRHLFPFILEGIKRCRPAVVFLENVEGILSARLSGDNWRDAAGTSVLLHVLRELERLGYRAEAGLFSAQECGGAPHLRKRVFIMAYANNQGLQGHWGSKQIRLQEGRKASEGCSAEGGKFEQSRILWPSRPGEHQHEWEPPRTIKPKMGRGIAGDSNRLGDAELFESYDNRELELRMLGNGVMPIVAEKAFVNLFNKLNK